MIIFATIPPIPVMGAPLEQDQNTGYENTENGGGWIRLIAGRTSGTYTSEVLDAGEGNVWEGIEWVEEEPVLNLAGSAWVGDEPETLADGSSRLGSSMGGLEGLKNADGAYEEIAEEEYVSGFAFVLSENAGENSGLYSLRWAHVLENVPEERDRYTLRIRGFTGGDGENVGVYAWNHTRSRWDLLGSIGAVENTLEVSFDWAALSAYVGRKKIQTMYADMEPDGSQTILHLDLCTLEWSHIATSSVKLRVRFSWDGELWSEWMGSNGAFSYFDVPPADLSGLPTGRFIQYQVLLSSSSGDLSGTLGPKASRIVPRSTKPVLLEDNGSGEVLSENGCGALEDWSGAVFGEPENEENTLRGAAIRLSHGRWRARLGRFGRGARGIADFSSSGMPVRLVGLRLKDWAEVEIEQEELENLPPEIPPPEGEPCYAGRMEVYRYLDISASIPNDLIEDVEISFAVQIGWLLRRPNGRVALYHFTGSRWEELRTSEEGTDGDYFLYRARSPGFSIYAIVWVSGESVYEGGTTGISGAASDDGVYENIYENDYSEVPGVENSYLLTIGPVSGTTTANDVFASFYNPSGSGRTAVIERVVIMVNATGTAARPTFTLRRITNVTSGGTAISASDVSKKDTRAPDTAMSIRYGPGITVSWAGTADSRMMSVIAPATAGTHQGHYEAVFQGEKLVLQQGEGIALYQEAAGSTAHRIYLLVEWKEVATAPTAQGEYLLTFPRLAGSTSAGYVYYSFYNPSGSGRTAVLRRVRISIDASGTASYTSNFALRRFTGSPTAGTTIAAANVPKKHTGSNNTAMDIRYSLGTTPGFTWSGTADSRLMLVIPPGTTNHQYAKKELVFEPNEPIILQPGEGVALYCEAAGSTSHLILATAEWDEETSTPSSQGEYLLAFPRVLATGVSSYVFYSFYNPAGSGRTAVVKRIGVRLVADGNAVYIPFTVRRFTGSPTAGTTIAAANVPKKHTGSGNTAMDIRYSLGT
ncbi:MAG: PGF-pre-PGF domain-containing protein, partial [Candidatus Hadarchaeales archaeon]